MARADLLCELIKAGLRKDDMTFREQRRQFVPKNEQNNMRY